MEIRAEAEGVVGIAQITVTPPPPPEVTTVQLTPGSAEVEVGQTVQFGADAIDQYGEPFVGAKLHLDQLR